MCRRKVKAEQYKEVQINKRKKLTNRSSSFVEAGSEMPSGMAAPAANHKETPT